MKDVVIGFAGAALVFCVLFVTANYFITYLPDQEEIKFGYEYRWITQQMEGEDAHHYLPTINKSMEDGIVQEFEYDKLQDIERVLNLKREKAKFELSFANHPHTDHSY